MYVIRKWEWNKQFDDKNLFHSRRRKSWENGEKSQTLKKTNGTKNMRVAIRSHAFHMCIKNISLDTLSIYFGSILGRKNYSLCFCAFGNLCQMGAVQLWGARNGISLKCTSSRRINMIRKRHRHTLSRPSRHRHVELGKRGRSWSCDTARQQAKRSHPSFVQGVREIEELISNIICWIIKIYVFQ